MFGVFKKSLPNDVQVAVCPDEHAISVARIRREKGMPPILELCDVQPLDSISLQGAEVARLTKLYHLGNYQCNSSLQLGNYSLLLVEAPDVRPEELRAAIRWKVRDLIDFHIDDAVLDVFEVPNQKAAGRNKMMYVVVARAELVQERIDQFSKAGLNLNVIDIPELSLRNITELLPEDVGGVAFVYLGSDQGLITITRQSTLYLSRRIETGLDRFPDHAVEKNDHAAIQHWLDSIIIEIQRSLDYYESHFSQPQVSAIVFSSLGREVPGMAEYLLRQLGIPSRVLNVNDLIDVTIPVPEDLQAHCLLSIGAALRQEDMTL